MLSKLRRQSITLLAMLALQFILGMILKLFVTLPAKHPGQVGNYYVRSGHSFIWAITLDGGIALFLHVLVAIGLLAHSIIFVIRAVKLGDKRWIWVGAIGLIGILAAFSNGLSFLDFNKAFSSFIMALGYIIATLAYATGIFEELQFRVKKSSD